MWDSLGNLSMCSPRYSLAGILSSFASLLNSLVMCVDTFSFISVGSLDSFPLISSFLTRDCFTL